MGGSTVFIICISILDSSVLINAGKDRLARSSITRSIYVGDSFILLSQSHKTFCICLCTILRIL